MCVSNGLVINCRLCGSVTISSAFCPQILLLRDYIYHCKTHLLPKHGILQCKVAFSWGSSWVMFCSSFECKMFKFAYWYRFQICTGTDTSSKDSNPPWYLWRQLPLRGENSSDMNPCTSALAALCWRDNFVAAFPQWCAVVCSTLLGCLPPNLATAQLSQDTAAVALYTPF